MAPLAPLGRKAAIARIRRGALPFAFGSPHPCAMVLEQDGVFRIRELVVDAAEARAAGEAALAGQGTWMPEQYYALGQPVGKIHAEAASRGELADRVRAMDWPEHW